MKKIDYKKELKSLYHACVKEVVLVEDPPLNFLMIDDSAADGVTASSPINKQLIKRPGQI